MPQGNHPCNSLERMKYIPQACDCTRPWAHCRTLDQICSPNPDQRTLYNPAGRKKEHSDSHELGANPAILRLCLVRAVQLPVPALGLARLLGLEPPAKLAVRLWPR